VTVQSFRDLIAWQRAMDLAESIYDATRNWPPEEQFGLASQVRRAAVSVMANIAEGQGRTGPREFLHHLSIADDSLSEVEAHLLFAHRLRFNDEATLDTLLQNLEKTRSPLRGLIRRLR
jgi:four helix bundle protein